MSSQGEDLSNWISKTGCYCLNESPNSTHTNIFSGDQSTSLKSDSDEQLLLHIEFMQTVRLTKLSLGLFNDDSCPHTVKLFCNSRNMGFSQASDESGAQVLTLKPPDATSLVSINLLAHKWKNVDSITLFVQDNYGSDVSSLYSLKLYGSPIMATGQTNA